MAYFSASCLADLADLAWPIFTQDDIGYRLLPSQIDLTTQFIAYGAKKIGPRMSRVKVARKKRTEAPASVIER
jgi:hypothetical protein